MYFDSQSGNIDAARMPREKRAHAAYQTRALRKNDPQVEETIFR